MAEFDVPDMSCGHCRAAILAALQDAAPAARVEVDLDARRLRVEGLTPAGVLAALAGAGYPASPVGG